MEILLSFNAIWRTMERIDGVIAILLEIIPRAPVQALMILFVNERNNLRTFQLETKIYSLSCLKQTQAGVHNCRFRRYLAATWCNSVYEKCLHLYVLFVVSK